MSMTRRQALTSAGAAAIAAALPSPRSPPTEPIRVGYLPALTGPSSSTGIGINRGIQLAVQEINAAGGINGRQLELITRDTQSDPTKAVNGAGRAHPRREGERRVRPGQFRRVARGRAAARPRQDRRRCIPAGSTP